MTENEVNRSLGSWNLLFNDYIDEIVELLNHIENLRKKEVIYPNQDNIFRAFRYTSPENLKVVMIFQDPYHQPNYADGIALSNSLSKDIAPSLRVFLEEIDKEYPRNTPYDIKYKKDLSRLAIQGVLLINTALTVKRSNVNSHRNLWKEFTGRLFRVLNTVDNIVIVAVGRQSENFLPIITNNKIVKLTVPHPASELYRSGSGFIGSNIFRRINEELLKFKKEEIIWN